MQCLKGPCGAALPNQTLHLLSQHRSTGILAFKCVTSVILFLLTSVCQCVEGCILSGEIAQHLDMTSIQGQCMLAVLTTTVDGVCGHIC